MAHKAENIYSLVLYRKKKNLPTSALDGHKRKDRFHT